MNKVSKCNLLLFYPFRTIKAIFNRFNLRLSQKSNSESQLDIFLNKLCSRHFMSNMPFNIIDFNLFFSKITRKEALSTFDQHSQPNNRMFIIFKVRKIFDNYMLNESFLSTHFPVVKRGCAHKDKRYDRNGCEEQLTGKGNFRLSLCLCDESYCNASEKPQISTLLLLIGLGFLVNNRGSMTKN